MRSNLAKVFYFILTVILFYLIIGVIVFDKNSDRNNRSTNVATIVGPHPKLICIIDTHPARFQNQDKDILITWAKRCDKTYWLTSKISNKKDLDKGFNFIEYMGHDSEHWGKVIYSLKYVYDKHQSDMEWIVKVSDDAFIVPENLRHFITDKNLRASDPLWLGAEHLTQTTKKVYMSREGYVLSKAAVYQLLHEGKGKAKNICDMATRNGDEEQELSKCCNSLQIKTVDTRDKLGRHRFLTGDVGSMLVPIYQNKNQRSKEMKYPYQQGPNCCAEDPILLMGGSMRFFDFMLYEMRYAGEK